MYGSLGLILLCCLVFHFLSLILLLDKFSPYSLKSAMSSADMADNPSHEGKNEAIPRLMIKKIVMENFKSYGGIKEIGPFHKCFSSVIGPNGRYVLCCCECGNMDRQG